MSDNLAVTPGTGSYVATKEESGVHHQKSLTEFQNDSGASQPVSRDNLLPVSAEDVVMLLAAILEKMPRVDQADRLMVSMAEVNPTVAIASSQTLATVSTLSDQTNVGGRSAAHAAFAWANAGAMHIYNNILVS